ncbi:MAG TPA: formate/nitrite transporter family protein [Gemmatimonadaceae bacterium]|nr:formate/nitrite transporter family protein [Gemmatimonadaceae bacterium]
MAQEEQAQGEAAESGSGPEKGTRFSASEIHENILEDAGEELDRPFLELAYSGFAAGLSIGFSFLAVVLLSAHMAPEHHDIAAALVYPLGFIYVVLARHQLFTENTLEPVIPLLEKRNLETLRKVIRLWSIVLPANLIGAAIFSFVVARTQLFEPAMSKNLIDTAVHATSGGFVVVFYKAIWAGWLVALMAWMLASTRETFAQIALIWLTTAPIAGLGFKHSIAGAIEAFYRAWVGEAGFWTMLGSFEIPALLGNIIGGVVLVALVNHGQAGSKK